MTIRIGIVRKKRSALKPKMKFRRSNREEITARKKDKRRILQRCDLS